MIAKNNGDLEDKRPCLDVCLSNAQLGLEEKGTLLLDTGSTSSFCNTDILKKLNVSPTQRFPRDVRGPGGVFQSLPFAVSLDPFVDVDDRYRIDWRMYSVGAGKIFGQFDGILGRDFLRYVSLEIVQGKWSVEVDLAVWKGAEF